MQRRDQCLAQSLGLSLTKRIKDSRVLLVGAGGIGCELLKNLVCCGFGSGGQQQQQSQNGTHNESAPNGDLAAPSSKPSVESEKAPGITVIDLDTIDLSNLNRQFLFRKHHIRKPKAFVAKETASQFNPSVHIDAHHASIFDRKYTVDFFQQFDVVFNALDNLAARRHVNKMCLATGVPLIESGTTGYNGQVQAIQKGITECYDCNPKPVQKSFPICTIRSTPSQPIHCIVWAKSYLFPELFGTSEEEDESADMEVTEGDNAEEVAKLKEEAQALQRIRSTMGTPDFAQAVFDKVYSDDINRLRSMSEMWASKKPPEALTYGVLKSGEQKLVEDLDLVKLGRESSVQDQRIWTLQENLAVFCYSLDTLSRRVQAGESAIEFDKDDKDTLDFVTAAANLRAHVFGIPLNSEWTTKQMAGNIIPAIATSNAMTASLCVTQAFKIIRSALSKATASGGKPEPRLGGSKMTFLTSRNTDRMISTEPLRTPNPDCPVCSPTYAKLSIPEKGEGSYTLQNLVGLLKDKLGYDDISITTDKGIIYDPDLEDNLEKPLSELDVHPDGNEFITVTDDSDESKVDLILSPTTGDAQVGLVLDPAVPALPLKAKKDVENGDLNGEGKNHAVLSAGAGEKRKREVEADVEVENGVKRAKAARQTAESIVIDDDGAILLED